MKAKLHWVLIILFSFILVLAACSGDSEDASKEDNTTDEQQNNDSNDSENKEEEEEKQEDSGTVETVNIGYTGPLSGPAAFYGEATLSGLELAVKEINEEGFEVNGQMYNINLVSLDDQYLPNEAAANAKRLVQENDTPIIFTPHSGGILAMQVFNEQDNFIIGAYSSEPAIIESGNSLTVRIPPGYDRYIEPFSNYAMDRFGPKLAALPTNSQYGVDWTEAIVPYWESQGGEVVYNSAIDFASETDFFTILTNALEGDPDVLFIGGPSQPTAMVAQQARELGFEGGFIIMDQAKLDEMKAVTGSYDILEGSIGVMPLVDSSSPGTDAFVEKYRAEHDIDPGSEAGLHYIAMYTFVEAMKAAGTVSDPQAIMENMQAGLDNLPEDKKVYVIPGISDKGAFESDVEVAAIEDGEVIAIPID